MGGLAADDAVEAYLAHLLEGIPDLDGLEVVVDCANGAAAQIAPEAYRRAGAKVTAVAADPDGHNINDGVGSTHPEHVQAALVRSGAVGWPTTATPTACWPWTSAAGWSTAT